MPKTDREELFKLVWTSQLGQYALNEEWTIELIDEIQEWHKTKLKQALKIIGTDGVPSNFLNKLHGDGLPK